MATWNGVITNAGNSLLNEWVNEKTLNFDSAAAGQGTVAAAAMMAQTALVNEKQTASLLGGERVSSGIRLKLRIAAPNTAYTLNQFRVSASVDGGASAMIALFQLEQGVPIPSKTESPDFVYTFYALISCSNTGTWTVTVDTSACGRYRRRQLSLRQLSPVERHGRVQHHQQCRKLQEGAERLLSKKLRYRRLHPRVLLPYYRRCRQQETVLLHRG